MGAKTRSLADLHRFLGFPFPKNAQERLLRRLTKARFTLQKIFGTARVKLARVPKKSSANFVYTKPFLPYQKYRDKSSHCRHAQFNYNQERPRDFGGEWAAILKYTQKTASLYQLRLKFGPLKCLHFLFYPNRAYFFSTRTIFTRARTASPKVPAWVRILIRHGWNLVLTCCLHCKFYPSRTFYFGTRANFTRAVPKNFCSVNRA